jgi:PAS domain S-box-containing protein
VAGESILIAEDEVIVARDLSTRLKNLGYVPLDPVYRGDDAIRVALDRRPDLVVMDIGLRGDIDGIDAARQIRAEADIPVIFITAFSDQETLQRAKGSEPFGYILKPIDEREIRTTVEMAIYKHATDHRLRESEERFRSAFEYAPIGMALVDADGVFSQVNKAFADFLGYERTELVGLDLAAITVSPDVFISRSAFQRLLTGQTGTLRYEKRYERKDGGVVWGLVSASLVKTRRTTPGYIIAQIQDITALKAQDERPDAEDLTRAGDDV